MPNAREKRSTKGLYDDNENLHNDGKDFHSSNNAAVVIKPLKKKKKKHVCMRIKFCNCCCCSAVLTIVQRCVKY